VVFYTLAVAIAALSFVGLPAVAGEELPQEAAFTKIANSGRALPPTAQLGAGKEDWACLRDNQTGLVWEIKTADSGLRDHRWTYTPYDSDPSTSGGFPGYKDQTSGRCLREKMAGSSCNTEAYIHAVRATRLCGFNDWRLPVVRELVAVSAQAADASPAATSRLLPNTLPGWYWTGIESIGITRFSRVILLPPGGQPTFYDGSYLVIAVRGGEGD
jgi:hypothetical protein